MQTSPLQLEDYFLRHLEFSLLSPLDDIPAEGLTYDNLGLQVVVSTKRRNDDPLKWRCELSIQAKEADEGDGKNYPYKFRLTYVGFFRVVKEFPEEFREQMVRTNAPAVLYSASREALMYITGRGRLPATLLPSVTFLEPPPSETEEKRVTTKRRVATKKSRKK